MLKNMGRKLLNTLSPRKVLSYIVALCVIAPVLSLLTIALTGNLAHWDNLLHYVIPEVSLNTLQLLVGVAIIVSLLGAGSAWITSAYDFPSKKILLWALLLPLAIPTYIMAFAYLDLLHPLGPIQTTIRDILNISSPREFRLPDIRGIWGAIFIMGLALYPYVYLSTRIMFISQPMNLIEAARTLGYSHREAFYYIIIPMARPALAVGISLALMETLNDIGASEFLGVRTLTVAIYNEWVTRSNLTGAAQIAIIMLLIVSLLLYIEKYSRLHHRYANTQKLKPISPQKITGYKAVILMILCWIPVVCGFLLPVLYLLSETTKRWQGFKQLSANLLSSTFNTVLLASIATLFTVLLGIFIVWVQRMNSRNQHYSLSKINSFGYAIPGTILAIGLLSPFVIMDNFIDWILNIFFYVPSQLYIMGSIAGLVIAYCIRFLAISIGSIESGYARIPLSLDNAASTLGYNSYQIFGYIHLPLLKSAIGVSSLLVFVDAMKELSATLLLRPLNFETLSTLLYAEAARGTYEDGAIAALLIVVVGILPVIILAKTQHSQA